MVTGWAIYDLITAAEVVVDLLYLFSQAVTHQHDADHFQIDTVEST